MKDDVGEVGAYLGGKARARAVTKMKMEVTPEFAPHVERAEGRAGNHNSLYVPRPRSTLQQSAALQCAISKVKPSARRSRRVTRANSGQVHALCSKPKWQALPPSGKLQREKQVLIDQLEPCACARRIGGVSQAMLLL